MYENNFRYSKYLIRNFFKCEILAMANTKRSNEYQVVFIVIPKATFIFDY